MKTTPQHHIRYTRAWMLHQEKNVSEKSRLILENEMDNAQNDFTWNEFQEFKQSLPGFIEHWDDWASKIK